MPQRLEGAAFRIFRFLLNDWDRDTVELLRMQSTKGEEIPTSRIERVLDELQKRGHVEEFQAGHWRITPRGLVVKQSLLGINL